MRLSASGINCYEWCPKKFKLQYIDKLKSKTKSPALKKGIELHELFEKFYDDLAKEKMINEETLMRTVKEIPVEFASKYSNHIQNFLDFNIKTLGKLENKNYIFPLATELKIYDEELDFVGVIDAVFTDGKNILVLDYKTGKPSIAIPEHYKLQLCVYKHLWDIENPKLKVTHWGLLYSDSTIGSHNPIIEKANPEEMQEMYKKIKEVKAKIDREEFPETSKKWVCKRCDMYEYCKELFF